MALPVPNFAISALLFPVLTVVSVCVRPLPLFEPLPLLPLALTVRPLLSCPKLKPAPIELPSNSEVYHIINFHHMKLLSLLS